jgi:starch phosphorylase
MNTHPSEFSNLPERLIGLSELAQNMWWSWNPNARMLFKMLDRPAWKESYYNPDKMLRELPAEILEKAASNPDYLRQYDVVMSQFKNHLAQKRLGFGPQGIGWKSRPDRCGRNLSNPGRRNHPAVL